MSLLAVREIPQFSQTLKKHTDAAPNRESEKWDYTQRLLNMHPLADRRLVTGTCREFADD